LFSDRNQIVESDPIPVESDQVPTALPAQNYSQFRQATKRSSNEYAFNFCKRQKTMIGELRMVLVDLNMYSIVILKFLQHKEEMLTYRKSIYPH